MIAGTEQLADDGLPLIEVRSLSRRGDQVTLDGTAVAYEGTVLFEVTDATSEVLTTTFTTASTGGPSRGEWDATVPLQPGATWLVVRQEEMEEGALTAARRRVVLPL